MIGDIEHIRVAPRLNCTPNRTAMDIANHLVSWADKRGEEINYLKLSQMIYLAYGRYMAETGRRLFRDSFEAWNFGPVIPSTYYEFMHFGMQPIKKKQRALDRIIHRQPIREGDIDNFLMRVWDEEVVKSDIELIKLTHTPGTPWHVIRSGTSEEVVIPDELIFTYHTLVAPNL